MTNDTRERARQVAHDIVSGICVDWHETEGDDHSPTCDAITDALVNAARNERTRIADRAEALARERAATAWSGYGHGVADALEALAAELRAEGGGT